MRILSVSTLEATNLELALAESALVEEGYGLQKRGGVAETLKTLYQRSLAKAPVNKETHFSEASGEHPS